MTNACEPTGFQIVVLRYGRSLLDPASRDNPLQSWQEAWDWLVANGYFTPDEKYTDKATRFLAKLDEAR